MPRYRIERIPIACWVDGNADAPSTLLDRRIIHIFRTISRSPANDVLEVLTEEDDPPVQHVTGAPAVLGDTREWPPKVITSISRAARMEAAGYDFTAGAGSDDAGT